MIYLVQMIILNICLLIFVPIPFFCGSSGISLMTSQLVLVFALGLFLYKAAMPLFEFCEQKANDFGIQGEFSITISVLSMTAIFMLSIPGGYYLHRYFQFDERPAALAFHQIRDSKKMFIRMESFSVEQIRGKNLQDKRGWNEYWPADLQFAELYPNAERKERTNVWLVCIRCTEKNAEERLKKSSIFLKRSETDYFNFLPEVDTEADRSKAVFYEILRGSPEEERAYILCVFFDSFLMLNGVFLLLSLIVSVFTYWEERHT